MARKETSVEISVEKIQQKVATYCVLGDSPLIMERMSVKAREVLLMGAGKKTAAEKQGRAKHNPLQEYRESAHCSKDDSAPTRLMMPATAFKAAMRDAAVEIPGAKKAQIGRLTYVPGEYVSIYGVPKLLMSVVRSSDMNKTPDIRTRCIVPQWAAVFDVTYIEPQLNFSAVANLLAAAGTVIGVGGYRPQKGAGAFGRFSIVAESEIASLVKSGGRDAQDAALEKPEFYDSDSEDLYRWYETEFSRRGFKVVA